MKLHFFLMLIIIPAKVFSGDVALIFGGGPNPEQSQFSIESNMIWFDKEMQQSNFDHYELVFGSNGSNDQEIQFSTASNADAARYLLASALGITNQNSLSYRASLITSNNGRQNTKSGLTATVTDMLEQMTSEDDLFLLYSGHGGRGKRTDENFFFLWNNTQLTVRELDALLSTAPEQSATRFVLPQCFSGAFNLLAFNELDASKGVKPSAPMCGFTSVASNRLAEGCTASINTEDYRDYASAFLSAITGTDRHGNPVSSAEDYDGDGQISLIEAHHHTYANTFSTDIPRSTSEDFLISLERWYIKFAPYMPLGDNRYYHLASELSRSVYSSTPGSLAFTNELADNLRSSNEMLLKLESEYGNNERALMSLRSTLQERLYLKWPSLAIPASQQFHSTIQTSITDINQWLDEQEEMGQILQLEETQQALTEQIVDASREHTRHLKVERAIKLARLYEYLYSSGSSNEQQDYEALLECESWNAPIVRADNN